MSTKQLKILKMLNIIDIGIQKQQIAKQNLYCYEYLHWTSPNYQ